MIIFESDPRYKLSLLSGMHSDEVASGKLYSKVINMTKPINENANIYLIT